MIWRYYFQLHGFLLVYTNVSFKSALSLAS